MAESNSDIHDVLLSYNYGKLRQLAQQHGVFKIGSKKKEALINRLLREVGVDSLKLDGVHNTESSEESLNISDSNSDKTITTSVKKPGKKKNRRKTKRIQNSSESNLYFEKENVPLNYEKSDSEEIECTDKSILSPHKKRASFKKDLGNKEFQAKESFEHEQSFSSPTLAGNEKERRETYSIDKSISCNKVLETREIENRRETFSMGRKGSILQTPAADKKVSASIQCFQINTKQDDQESEISQVKENRRGTFSVTRKKASNAQKKCTETLVMEDKCSSGSPLVASIRKSSLRGYQNELQSIENNSSKQGNNTDKDQDDAMNKSFNTKENRSQIFSDCRKRSLPKTPKDELQLKGDSQNIAPSHFNEKKSVAFNCLSPESSYRTPMKTKTTPHPAKKSASKLKGTFSAKKMPNFAAIHKKNFDQMESLLKYSSRKSERAKFLLSPAAIPLKSVDRKKLPLSSSKKDISKRAKSCIPIRAKKSLPIAEHNDSPKTNYYKLHTTTMESLKEKNKEIIKGVRINKRFKLQMKMRNLVE